jgi:hypothetical protein
MDLAYVSPFLDEMSDIHTTSSISGYLNNVLSTHLLVGNVASLKLPFLDHHSGEAIMGLIVQRIQSEPIHFVWEKNEQ